MKSSTLVGWVMAMVVAVLLAGSAGADWNQTGAGPHAYTNAANWSDGVPNGVWPSSLTLATNQVAEFDSNYTLTSPLLLRHQSAYTLTFRGSGANRTLTLGGDVTAANNIAGKVIFGSTTEGQKLNVALAANRVFSSTVQFSNGMGFLNDVTGPFDITKRGPYSLHFAGSTSFSGSLRIEEGDVAMTYNGVLTSVAQVILGGALRIDPYNAVQFRLDNRSGGVGPSPVNMADRLPDSIPVYARGSSQVYFRGNDSAVASETIGTYAADSGINQLTCVMEGSGAVNEKMATLTIANLSRVVGTAIQMQGGGNNTLPTTYRNLGQGNGDGNARILASQINGAAPPAAMVNGIVPWAVVGYTPGPSYTWKSFATYGANGFKPYGYDKDGNLIGGAEPYVTSLASPTATDNVLIDATATLSGNQAINSLTIAPAAGFTLGTSTADKLTIGSGAIVVRNGGAPTFACTVDFNDREAILHANQNWVYFNANTITNTGGNGLTVPTGIVGLYAQKYTGTTRILEQGKIGCKADNALPTNTALSVWGSGELAIYGANNLTIGSLSGSGVIAFNIDGAGFTGTRTLTVGTDNTSTTFSGNINPVSPGTDNRLTKVGSGTLTLSGTNYHAGATTVSGGGLIVNSAISGAGGTVTVASGAMLGGTGWVDRVVSVQSNGTVTAGTTNTAGTFTLSSNLLMNAGGVLACNINGSNDYDRIVVGGSTVNLNADSGTSGATLQLSLGYAPKAGQKFTILSSSGATISGSFASGSTIKASYGGGSYTFSISTTGGNIVLTTMTSGTMLYIR